MSWRWVGESYVLETIREVEIYNHACKRRRVFILETAWIYIRRCKDSWTTKDWRFEDLYFWCRFLASCFHQKKFINHSQRCFSFLALGLEAASTPPPLTSMIPYPAAEVQALVAYSQCCSHPFGWTVEWGEMYGEGWWQQWMLQMRTWRVSISTVLS